MSKITLLAQMIQMLPAEKANSQVEVAPIPFNQCAAFAFVCKNRTELIHQQTLRKKTSLGARKYPIEYVYLA
jgi:hypothetical protein